MAIASDLIRGHTETIILAHLLQGDSYGYEVKYELKEATLYTAFRRLEESGCIYSYWGDEQTGARRRYYSITKHGKQTYQRLREEWEVAKKLIDILIGEEKSDER